MIDTDNEHTFVELNRTFFELSKNASDSDDIDLLQHHLRGKRLSWVDVTQEYRVVIISEAGSGKTEEIRHVAETLRQAGKTAFFLRLEHVANDFEDAFEVGTLEEFNAWLAGSNEGWLLLDSVDEARLRDPRDFEFAIRKLGRRIAAAMQRVHIVITGRPDAWRPKTDLEHCLRHFPLAPSRVAVAEEVNTINEGASERHFRTVNVPEQTERSALKIVALADLESDQIKVHRTIWGGSNFEFD